MRILLTNDDGIHAPGLLALQQALTGDHDVDIVAPEVEMSAVGHAITLTSPLRVRPVNKNGAFYGFAVSGTPADCVKIAVRELMKFPPDIVLSGINLGANVGVNVLYSGTVSAATEGAFLGIKSAAISLNTYENPDFQFAAQFSRRIIQYMAANGLKEGTALNVNIPALPPHEIAGVSITRQGVSRFEERYDRRIDPRGIVYYWLSGEKQVDTDRPHTDANALKRSMITITPIQYNLTSEEEFVRLGGCEPPRV
jgi:5'-nucleotidase